MFCAKCGAQLPDTAQFCANCGASVLQPYQQSYQNSFQQPYQDYQAAAHANRAATTALVCGIVGFFFAGLILGFIAVIQANSAKKQGYMGGKATAGFVLGVIDVIGWAILMIMLFS